MTQKEFANLIGIARPTIAKIEVNAQNINLDLLLKICLGLKLSPVDFMRHLEGLKLPPISDRREKILIQKLEKIEEQKIKILRELEAKE